MTLPVTLPVNITSVMYVQIRMVTAIAIMGGYNVKDDRIRTLVYSCIAANSIAEVAKDFDKGNKKNTNRSYKKNQSGYRF